MILPDHKTKLVCTIGPASNTLPLMEQMLLAGMGIARLNFSHGNFKEHARNIRLLRTAARNTGRRLAILADLPGPKIRIGSFSAGGIELKTGGQFTLTTGEVDGDSSRVTVNFPPLPSVVKPGCMLYLNDGYIQLEVESASGSEVRCRVVAGGELRSRKGLNLPGIDLGISAFTPHDRECLLFALEHGADAVSQSFVERAADLAAVRQASREAGHPVFVFAKIERSRSLEHLEEILAAADGIMIARGDLGVELPIEQLPGIQKMLIRECNRRAVPVITATQMLESMITNRRPTRAEATDVANAVLDGTDAVMLSAESAAGSFPVEAVRMLATLTAAAENLRPRCHSAPGYLQSAGLSQLVELSIARALEHATPAAVFVPSHSGATARRISRHHLPVWIVAVSQDPAVCQRLQFSYGIHPALEAESPADWNAYIAQWTDRHELPERISLLAAGPSRKDPGGNYRMEIIVRAGP